MSGKEKLYFLVNRIEDAKAITPSGRPLVIDPLNDLNNNLSPTELSFLFIKLEQDEKVIKLIKAPQRAKTILSELDPYDHANDGCWRIELLPTFDRFYSEIQHQPEYQAFSGRRPAQSQSSTKPSIKPNRKALEKIWNVLQEIEHRRNITLADDDIAIPQVHLSKVKNEKEADEAADERFNILRKLEKEETAIKDVRWPNDHNKFAYLKIADNYFETFNKYEEEYKKVAQQYQNNQEEENIKSENIVYEVKYSDRTREILINGFLLTKPDFDSENEVVFDFLYRNPNKTYKLVEIETDLKRSINKTLHKIVENLGFIGDVKKIFFDVSKDSICFRNPITKQELDKIGISRIKLQK